MGETMAASIGGGDAERKNPVKNVTMLALLKDKTVRGMSCDSAVSKGYDCLVAVLLGSTPNDGRTIRSPVIFTVRKRKREDLLPPSHNA